MVSMELGTGSGIAGFGVPKLRAFAGLRVTSPERGDEDGDGILDSKDECPDQPEDFDSWDDSDGCPDPDNDGDGIPDVDDACPENAENKGVGYDDDGCPDLIEEQPSEAQEKDPESETGEQNVPSSDSVDSPSTEADSKPAPTSDTSEGEAPSEGEPN